MPYLRIVLLSILAILFFGLEPIGRKLWGAKNIWIFGVSLFGPGVQDLLGAGILLCELSLVLTYINLLRAIKNILDFLKNSIRVLPLLVFGLTVYKAFWPLLSNVLVDPIAQVFGFSTGEPYLTQTISVKDIMLTLAAMLFVIVANWTFNPHPKSN
jgi:hypothetical protein